MNQFQFWEEFGLYTDNGTLFAMWEFSQIEQDNLNPNNYCLGDRETILDMVASKSIAHVVKDIIEYEHYAHNTMKFDCVY